MMECTNPGLFSAGPDWLEPGEPRRHEALWQLARRTAESEGDELRRHVDECRSCGRLGTTCMTLLTLEVYYRHLPLYKRDTGGLKELERIK